MAANKDGKAVRQAKVLEERIKGKNFKEIGEACGTSESTAWRDWKELGEDESIQQAVAELRQRNLANALNATDIESTFIKKLIDKGIVTREEVETANKIKVSSQKIHTALQGANTDDKGGEKEYIEFAKAVIKNYLDEQN